VTTWVKVFNSMAAHPKMVAANAGQPCTPGWLFVCGLCYSNEHLTDGFIAVHALSVVAPGTTRTEAAAARLVTVALWHVVEGGWRIHDYDEHQRSADEIRERRERDRTRKTRGVRMDSSGIPRGIPADSAGIPDGFRDPEVEVEVEVEVEGRKQKADLARERADMQECFQYWQERTNHPQAKFTDGRKRVLRARLRESYTVQQIRQGIDGAAANPPRDRDTGVVYDDLTSICRNGEQLERYMERATAKRATGRIERTPLRVVSDMSPDTQQRIAAAQERLKREADGVA